jgi:hypothetical protein
LVPVPRIRPPVAVLGARALKAPEAVVCPVPPEPIPRGEELVGIESIVCTWDTVKSSSLAVDPVLLPLSVMVGAWARMAFVTALFAMNFVFI